MTSLGKHWKNGKQSEEHKRKQRESHLGKKLNLTLEDRNNRKELCRKLGKMPKKPLTIEQRKILSEIRIGEKSHFWRGGKTKTSKIIRESLEYKLWRKSVFERDNYTCIWCGQKGGKLNADHIKPFSLFPELRFAIDNGRTLCYKCHLTTETYGGKVKLWRQT